MCWTSSCIRTTQCRLQSISTENVQRLCLLRFFDPTWTFMLLPLNVTRRVRGVIGATLLLPPVPAMRRYSQRCISSYLPAASVPPLLQLPCSVWKKIGLDNELDNVLWTLPWQWFLGSSLHDSVSRTLPTWIKLICIFNPYWACHAMHATNWWLLRNLSLICAAARIRNHMSKQM